jgi:hypothetical protein
MKFEKIQPGMVLYDRHKYRAGNTTMRLLGEWDVRIVSVDPVTRTAEAHWNGNPATHWRERDLAKLKDWSMYDDCAEIVKGVLGPISVRKKRRAPASAPPEASGLRERGEALVAKWRKTADERFPVGDGLSASDANEAGALIARSWLRECASDLWEALSPWPAALAATPDARPDPTTLCRDCTVWDSAGDWCNTVLARRYGTDPACVKFRALPASPQATTPAPQPCENEWHGDACDGSRQHCHPVPSPSHDAKENKR